MTNLKSKQLVAAPLLTEPIPVMIRKIGIPVGIGAFFNTMFNVVDTIYGGLISDEVLAALSLSFPIAFIIIALGFGLSIGGTALIGNALGSNDRKLAQAFAVQSVAFSIFIGLITTAIILPVAPALLSFLGATDPAYRQLALNYINPLFYGAVFFLVVQALFASLNALGNTLPGRNFLIAGFFLNLLLNPWFIFGGFGLPAMGIQGIAWATVLVQFLGCIYAAYELSKAGLVTRASLKRDWVPRFEMFGRIAKQGLPNTIDVLGVSVGFFILTYYISQFGQNSVAAFGAASRIEQLALLPVLGINTAVLALVAQNNGAGNIGRVHETLRIGIRFGAILMLSTMVIVIAFARPLMMMFTSDPEIIQVGVEYIRIRSFGLIPNAIFFAASNTLRGLKRPMWPLFWSMIRFVVLPWLFIVIFVTWQGYGLTAIWVTSTAAFLIVAIGTLFTAYRLLPSLNDVKLKTGT
ncbi:MAG: MATE family efflux transporter [Anaerolineae bacterium]